MRRAGILKAGALALLAPVVLIAAGCGSSSRLSKSAYEKKVSSDGSSIKDAFQKISSNPSSLDVLAKQVGDGQSKLRKAADDLDGVKPPKNVEQDNDKLVKGLRALADGLEPLRKGALKGDAKMVSKASSDLQSSSALKDAQAATGDMKSKGYKIGALGN